MSLLRKQELRRLLSSPNGGSHQVLNGYDLSGLEDLRNTPAGLLRALADASPRPADADDQLVELMGNLANLRVAITAENVEALAYIAERWPDEKVQKDLRAWAEAWRKRLESRDWR